MKHRDPDTFYTTECGYDDDDDLPDPLECEHKWEDDDDYHYQEAIEYCSKCGLASCIHNWGFSAQKVGDEYKHVCIYCGETKELSDRCKSGEHCHCDSGICCWCGLPYPQKWIHHPEDITNYINHYNRIDKRVREIFDMEIERLDMGTSSEIGEWYISVCDENGKETKEWMQRKNIDFSDMKSGGLVIVYWQRFFGESDSDTMEFPLKVLCNNTLYEEWLEDVRKANEEKEKERKKAEKDRKKAQKVANIKAEKERLLELMKKYPELVKNDG